METEIREEGRNTDCEDDKKREEKRMGKKDRKLKKREIEPTATDILVL